MRTRHLSRLLIVATLVISTAPLSAQRQQQDVAKLKEDARNAVGVIGADKNKTRTYCEIVELLGRQLERADQKDKRAKQKDKNQTEALLQKINQLRKKAVEQASSTDAALSSNVINSRRLIDAPSGDDGP